jgi:hypothetical protein
MGDDKFQVSGDERAKRIENATDEAQSSLDGLHRNLDSIGKEVEKAKKDGTITDANISRRIGEEIQVIESGTKQAHEKAEKIRKDLGIRSLDEKAVEQEKKNAKNATNTGTKKK